MKKFRANRKKTFYRTTKQIHAQDNHMLSSLKKGYYPVRRKMCDPPGFCLTARLTNGGRKIKGCTPSFTAARLQGKKLI